MARTEIDKTEAMIVGYAISEEMRDHLDMDAEGGEWLCSCGAPIAEDDGGYEPEERHEEHQNFALGYVAIRTLERLRKPATPEVDAVLARANDPKRVCRDCGEHSTACTCLLGPVIARRLGG
jgi:hypothetical protein